MALHEAGILEKYNVELIGANVAAINAGEDRQLFKGVVDRVREQYGLDASVAKSFICHTMDDCVKAVGELNYPVVVRPSFTMGGLGSGIAYNREDLDLIAGAACTTRRPPRCSWRSPSSAGRSTSSS